MCFSGTPDIKHDNGDVNDYKEVTPLKNENIVKCAVRLQIIVNMKTLFVDVLGTLDVCC